MDRIQERIAAAEKQLYGAGVEGKIHLAVSGDDILQINVYNSNGYELPRSGGPARRCTPLQAGRSCFSACGCLYAAERKRKHKPKNPETFVSGFF